jgi:hypothetical protein
MSDFTVDDEEDEEEADARRKLKAKVKGKGKASANRGRAIVLDSEDEWEPEEAEVVFGHGEKDEKPLTEEQLKFMPKFLPSTKMTVRVALHAVCGAWC